MKRKWVPVSFNYLQCDEMADWLGKMAGRGWNFRRFCFGFLFDACEPEEQVYDVQVFLKNTENDLAPTEDTLDFASYCEAAGWELVDSRGRFVVFRRIREDAVPILTPQERLETSFGAQKISAVTGFIVSLLILLISWGYILLLDFRLSHSAVNVFNPIFLAVGVMYFLLLLEQAFYLLYTYIWHKRKKQEIGQTGQLNCRIGRMGKILHRILLCAWTALVIWLAVFLISNLVQRHPSGWQSIHFGIAWLPLFAIYGVKFYNQLGRPTRETRQRRIILAGLFCLFAVWFFSMIQSVYGKEDDSLPKPIQEISPPIAVTDLIEIRDERDTESFSTFFRHNVLGTVIRYEIDCPTPGFEEALQAWEEEMNRPGRTWTDEKLTEWENHPPVDEDGVFLEYELCKTPYRVVADFVWNRLVSSAKRTSEADAEGIRDVTVEWNADQAIYLEAGNAEGGLYFVRYILPAQEHESEKTAILVIGFKQGITETLNQTQIATFREKLGL